MTTQNLYPQSSYSMDWDTIKLFLALYRSGSARAAAMELSTSASTITRKVSLLERALNTKLFSRTNGGFELTEQGQELLHIALRMENDAFEISRRIQAKDQHMHGKICVTFPNHFASSPIVHYLAQFARLHPKINIQMVPTFSPLDLNRGEADIALRLYLKGRSPSGELIGAPVTAIYCANYASREYINAHKPDAWQWLGWGETENSPDWVQSSAYPEIITHHQMVEPTAQLYAAKAGMGLAMLPCFMCDPEPDLMRTPAHTRWHRFDLWMLSHPDVRDTVRFHALRQYLKSAFKADQTFWSGDLNARGATQAAI